MQKRFTYKRKEIFYSTNCSLSSQLKCCKILVYAVPLQFNYQLYQINCSFTMQLRCCKLCSLYSSNIFKQSTVLHKLQVMCILGLPVLRLMQRIISSVSTKSSFMAGQVQDWFFVHCIKRSTFAMLLYVNFN